MPVRIILQVANASINGSTIDAIEYFLTAYNYNKSLLLIFVTEQNIPHNYKKTIIGLIKSRYIDYKDECFDNIRVITKRELLNTVFDVALIVDWNTIKHIKNIIRAKKIIVISELYTENKEYFLSPSLYPVVYYGEMPFIYKDVNYKMKFAFDLYPKIENQDVASSYMYVNSPNNDIDNDKRIQNLALEHEKKIIKKSPKHVTNFFSSFDTYLYYHANKYFDPHPRLFHECAFYNKKIIYENPHNIQDGSYYRYNDLLANGLDGRYLDESDEIIQALI